MGTQKFSELISEFTGEPKAGPAPSYREGSVIEVCWDKNATSEYKTCNQKCTANHDSADICLLCHQTFRDHKTHKCKDGKHAKFIVSSQTENVDSVIYSNPRPDIDTFRIFTPKDDSCIVDSVCNSVFKCEGRCFFAGQSIRFHGSLPTPLKAQTEYFIQQCDGSGNFMVCCSKDDEEKLSIEPHHLAFSVVWNTRIEDVTVKAGSNEEHVFTSSQPHRLNEHDPLRISNPAYLSRHNLKDRVYVKRVLTPKSFTISNTLDQWDKAGDEVRGNVESESCIGPLCVDNPPECTWKRCTITSFMNTAIPGGHPDQSFQVEFEDGTSMNNVHISCARIVKTGDEAPGGVIFIDETYDLMPNENQTGKSILNLIMDAAENHRDKVSFIIAGYKNRIERDLYSANPGMSGRFIPIQFADYSDDELQSIWMSLCCNSSPKIICSQKVAKIATLRVARRRDVWDFANARAVNTLFDFSTRRFKSLLSGPFELTTEDIVGKEPSLTSNSELRAIFDELDKLMGLKKASSSTVTFYCISHGIFAGQECFQANS